MFPYLFLFSFCANLAMEELAEQFEFDLDGTQTEKKRKEETKFPRFASSSFAIICNTNRSSKI